MSEKAKRHPNAAFFDRRTGWSITIEGTTIRGFEDKGQAESARQYAAAIHNRDGRVPEREELRSLGLL